MTTLLCSSSSLSHTDVCGTGRSSMKLSLVCTRTLRNEVGRLPIVGGKTALESVYDSTTADQVLH